MESISKEAKDLIRKMLVLTPERRISIPEMLSHPWVKEPLDSETEIMHSEHDFKVGAGQLR